ncbi:MAG: hypothetical protein AAF891_05325 [Pseudomonadota bacterium]
MTNAEFAKERDALELKRMRAEAAYYEQLASGEARSAEMRQTFLLLIAGIVFGLTLTAIVQFIV